MFSRLICAPGHSRRFMLPLFSWFLVPQVHRQADQVFVGVLHRLRAHTITEDDVAWFEHNCSSIAGVPPDAPRTYLAPLRAVRPLMKLFNPAKYRKISLIGAGGSC